MPNYQRRIVYLSEAQYLQLRTNGSITVDGVTIPYSANDMYVTPQGGTIDGELIAPLYENLVFPVEETDPCIHENQLYYANQNIATSEVWTPAHWLGPTNVGDELATLKSAINSMEESIAPVESSATATSAHAVGELFILDDSLLVALSAIAVGDTITTTGGSPNAAVTTLSSKLIKDVQVNGSSVLSNGVANVPIADASTPGVVIVRQNTDGLSIDSNNRLTIAAATAANIKSGSNGTNYRAITPYIQKYSVFYGLAESAGDTSQSSSSNAVGTYTEDAQSKISDMLNKPVTVSGTTPSITAKSGVRYVCGECSTLSITAPESGCIDVVFESGSTATVLTVTSAKSGVTAIKWVNGFDPSSLDANTTYEINILDGEYGVALAWT